MALNVNTFVWVNEPSIGAKPEPIVGTEPIASDFANAEAFIPMSADLAVKKSQYTEDMMGGERKETINKSTDNKKE